MAKVRDLKKRARRSAEDVFKELIDEYFVVDDLYRLFNDERNRLMDAIRKKLRYGHRPLGVHMGHFFALNAHLVRRKQFVQERARRRMKLASFNQCFKRQKYIQLDALEQIDISALEQRREAAARKEAHTSRTQVALRATSAPVQQELFTTEDIQ